MKIRLDKSESNAWLLISLLVIVFFLYQWMIIYTVLTMPCDPLEKFWLAPNQVGIAPFYAFMVTFILLAIWATLEIIAANLSGYSDRWFCTATCSVVLLCIIAVMTTFRAQWEHYEVSWGIRSHQSLTFQVIYMPDEIKIDPGHEAFIHERCGNQNPVNK